jgi:YVTN family beta-propeller protein
MVAITHSCTWENPLFNNDTGYEHGVFVTNEGAFGNSNGSVSYVGEDSTSAVNHLFEMVNGRPLGDVVQSMAIAMDKGFIIVNNSQKVEIVDIKTFESLGVITGLEYPRFMVAVDKKKGYLTDGNFTGRVYVLDLNLLTITDTIPVGQGPEHMIIFEERLIVANSGGWGNDSTLTVIDTQTDQVIATWKTGDNPTDMVLDRNDDLWVLCKGQVVWEGWNIAKETSSSLCKMDPVTGQLKKKIDIGQVGDYYWPLAIGITSDGKSLRFLEAGGIYSIDYESSEAPGTPLIEGTFYGFGIDPESDIIHGLVAPTFTGAGWLIRYEPSGQIRDSIQVGIGPNRVVFN